MKISHVSQDPQSSHYLVGLAGHYRAADYPVGSELRCAGYRFTIVESVASSEEHLALLVSGDDPPQLGMVVHPAAEPLTDEELAAAVQHLLMVPRMLKALDALGVLRRLEQVPDTETSEVRFAAIIVQNMALQVSRLILPTDNGLQEAERYKAELLGAC